MADEDLDAVADRLYALAPEEFTAARDAAAKEADDKGLRAAVKALRRPSASAWVVDVLAREQPDLLEQLLALGPALAEAQQGGQGDALRELGQQRRELVAAVTAAAVELVDRPVTAQVRAEVEQTLEAALADPAGAQAVRSGRLVRALSFAGFGGVDLDGALAVPLPRPGTRSKATAASTAATRKRGTAEPAAAQALARAEAAALNAAAVLDDAVRAAETAARQRDETVQAVQRADDAASAAEHAVRDLETRLGEARRTAQDATKARAAATQEQERAERTAARRREGVQAAQAAVETARAELDRLRRT